MEYKQRNFREFKSRLVDGNEVEDYAKSDPVPCRVIIDLNIISGVIEYADFNANQLSPGMCKIFLDDGSTIVVRHPYDEVKQLLIKEVI
jgi:hypothetical protein